MSSVSFPLRRRPTPRFNAQVLGALKEPELVFGPVKAATSIEFDVRPDGSIHTDYWVMAHWGGLGEPDDVVYCR